MVLAILSPILWAWYVTWGVLVLAPVATARLRTAIIAIATIETFVGLASVRGIVVAFGPNGPLADVVLIAALVAIAIVPLSQMRKRRHDHEAMPTGTRGPRHLIGLALVLHLLVADHKPVTARRRARNPGRVSPRFRERSVPER